MRCPGCGREGIEGGMFCEHCGHSLSTAVASPSPHPSKGVNSADKRFLMMVVMIVGVTMIGTVILSPLLLASESEKKEIVIDPYSYYTVRLEFYGMGYLEYSDGQMSGPQILLLELNRANYERFVAGEEYDYSRYGMVSYGGEGTSTETGAIWVRYLVFVNDNPTQATMEFGYKATPFASLLVAGPLFGASLLIVLCAIILTKRRHRAI